MSKKNNLLKLVIYIVAFGIFAWYEYQLGLKYFEEYKVRKEKIKENTERIENSFLLRQRYFYLDKEYLNKLKELKKSNVVDNEEGGDSFGYSEKL